MGVELKFAGLDPLHEITVAGIDGYGDAFDPLLLPSVRLPWKSWRRRPSRFLRRRIFISKS